MDAKIFDTLLEAVFIIDDRKKILYCNEPASLLCGISVRKVIRQQPIIDELFHFSEPIGNLANLIEVTEPTAYQEVAFRTDNEKTGKVQVTIQPFSETHSDKSWIVFFRDVTLEETLQKKYRAELEQKEGVILDLQKARAELEKYSKNLEKMVDERTAEIQKLNQMMAALLDSLHQGFFVFNRDGLCLEVFSKACEHTVQIKPAGHKIWDVLKLEAKQVPGFQKWMLTVFGEMLPFEDLTALAPQKFNHTEGAEIQLEYYPLRTADGVLEGVVVVATDITELIEAQREAESERAHAKMIVSLIQHKRQILSFLQDSESLLSEMKQEFQKGPQADPESLFRCLHTLKGGAASFSIKPMADQAHESESLLTQWKCEPNPELFEKLKTASLGIEDQFQKFTVENEKILGPAEKVRQRWVEVPAESLSQFQGKLPLHLQQEFVSEFLMEPIGNLFRQYDEVAQAVAEREMKSLAPLKFNNGQLAVLPEPYNQLFSTFIHAYRNAVDHGIESPSRREEAGKLTQGSIETTFSVFKEAQTEWLQIEVRDDGGGVDPQKIRDRLKSKGIETSEETDAQVIQHLFDSQFSTKETVTETSGRGVGMDAILHAAQRLGGTAWVESNLGQGTCLKVKVPYLRTWAASQKKAA
jgi:two-component system chemotaxis sensor kinase CheA